MAKGQKILRHLVKEVVVDWDTLTIRHSIRIPNAGPDSSGTIRRLTHGSRRSNPARVIGLR